MLGLRGVGWGKLRRRQNMMANSVYVQQGYRGRGRGDNLKTV